MMVFKNQVNVWKSVSAEGMKHFQLYHKVYVENKLEILIFKGKRRRNRNKKKAFAEENRGFVIEESTLSNKELRNLRQAERRLNRDEIYSLKKVQTLKAVRGDVMFELVGVGDLQIFLTV